MQAGNLLAVVKPVDDRVPRVDLICRHLRVAVVVGPDSVHNHQVQVVDEGPSRAREGGRVCPDQRGLERRRRGCDLRVRRHASRQWFESRRQATALPRPSARRPVGTCSL